MFELTKDWPLQPLVAKSLAYRRDTAPSQHPRTERANYRVQTPPSALARVPVADRRSTQRGPAAGGHAGTPGARDQVRGHTQTAAVRALWQGSHLVAQAGVSTPMLDEF